VTLLGHEWPPFVAMHGPESFKNCYTWSVMLALGKPDKAARLLGRLWWTRTRWKDDPIQELGFNRFRARTANDMSIRLTEANRAIHAALAKARNLAVNITVTVCDADGRLVAFQRMDGALAEADLASIGKALASVTSGRPSGDASVVDQRYFPRAATIIGEGIPLLRRPGGLPIIRAGEVAGAIGVGGASDEQDEECALAGIDALEEKSDPLEENRGRSP
jgi:glc operon protein GlcG